MTNSLAHPVRRRLLILSGRLAIHVLASGSILSEPLYVRYDANTLPGQDPTAPWAELGHNGVLLVSNGVLTAIDPDMSAWIFMHRFEPSLVAYHIINVEARVRVPSNNGVIGSPQLSLYDYDQDRPPNNFGHLWYGVDLFTNAIEFAKWDNDAGGLRTLFAHVEVPDLSTEFHLIRMTREESGTRGFQIYLDGVSVATVSGEPTDRPLDGVGFGYGMSLGVGESHWDFVRYWSEEPVAATPTTWGRIKATLR